MDTFILLAGIYFTIMARIRCSARLFPIFAQTTATHKTQHDRISFYFYILVLISWRLLSFIFSRSFVRLQSNAIARQTISFFVVAVDISSHHTCVCAHATATMPRHHFNFIQIFAGFRNLTPFACRFSAPIHRAGFTTFVFLLDTIFPFSSRLRRRRHRSCQCLCFSLNFRSY